ncbi:ATP-binding cassette domain-containing protein [Pseudooceanicola sp. GBMRC 2024]|uniref:ATP-binding cassette domain-containing protein n=1 Tax=Pseudooceanicola albus TaxID=2692189 RepID=A0A6L7G051_9RHOB|nr:ABC transporter ATP-binding protein [Pseudooceanicola albus]MXN17734.1 ATP-binding cassette domain-containing protein [Pseudooceanicola albus]
MNPAELPLDIQGLSVTYGAARPALSDVTLRVAPGEVLGLVGDGGSGKSTLIDAAVGLLPAKAARQGAVRIFGQELEQLPAAERQRLRGTSVGTIVAGGRARLNPMARIGAQIEAVLLDHGRSRREAGERALQLLGDVGIPDPKSRFHAYPHELSGGMAQRAVIAIALACDPRLIIADEPTKGLDVTIQADILELLGRLIADLGATAVIATRDLGIVAERCSRVIVLEAGRMVEDQPVRDFFRAPLSQAGRSLLEAEHAIAAPQPERA